MGRTVTSHDPRPPLPPLLLLPPTVVAAAAAAAAAQERMYIHGGRPHSLSARHSFLQQYHATVRTVPTVLVPGYLSRHGTRGSVPRYPHHREKDLTGRLTLHLFIYHLGCVSFRLCFWASTMCLGARQSPPPESRFESVCQFIANDSHVD